MKVLPLFLKLIMANAECYKNLGAVVKRTEEKCIKSSLLSVLTMH